ncbi:MAG: tRNA (adenosine(37)-N6)-threonylcarbamoyltransferase complex transferase subunit TsaD [Acidobacteriota bacterium]
MSKRTLILGIETSCDETSAAVMADGVLLSNIISSQLVHHQYGGVVPELASRAHQRHIIPIVDEALRQAGVERKELSAVAVAIGPGLMGALLVGVNFGKALAYGLGIPFIGVNHMEAHIYSNFIDPPVPQFPCLNLTVSGGHTQLVLMRDDFTYELIGETRDDAAGEAFDKVAKMMGLGYPGGPRIDALAKQGNPSAIAFPRTMLHDDEFAFSFSGIKTSVLYYLRDHRLQPVNGECIISQPLLSDLCASFQAAVIDVLVQKTINAARKFRVRQIAVGGGVSANSSLRERMRAAAAEARCDVFFPKLEYCTDNAAMTAVVGYRKHVRGMSSPLSASAVSNLEFAAS